MLWDKTGFGEHPDDFEPLAEYSLPAVFFRGLESSVTVAQDSGPVEGIIQKVTRRFGEAVSELVRPIGSEKMKSQAPTVITTVGLRDFLKQHPHPAAKTPYCVDNARTGKTADWYSGARFCQACRDRLALVTALERHAAVRVHPVR
jgi:hypothetical protein